MFLTVLVIRNTITNEHKIYKCSLTQIKKKRSKKNKKEPIAEKY